MRKTKKKPIIGILTDTKPLTQIIKSGIDSKKYKVIEFSSLGLQLTEYLQKSSLECLFLKTTLQNSNGLEICASIKSNPECKDMKIIFLSSSRKVAEDAIQYRADHFLEIPFRGREVAEAVAKYLPIQKTILYVEDSTMFHKSVVPELEKEGYKVIEAWDGEEGLEKARTTPVDLIISDVEMPKMDGYSLCSAVKSDEVIQDIPVIITTTLDSEEAIEKGFASGANDYLTKPFVIPELLSRVKQHLQDDVIKRPERILVVGSDPISRTIITHALGLNNFEVEEVRHGRIALAQLKSRPYHLVISAYDMPVMDGLEFAKQIRSSPGFSSLPIILISNRQNRADLIKIKSLNIQAFIVEPYTTERLIAEVERILAQDRLKREREVLKHYLTDEAINAVFRAVDYGAGDIKVEDAFRTILFTDIESFTPMCEKLTSHEAVSLLNIYFDKMISVLYRFEARIDKFIGDAVMALFDRQEDGAHRAIVAGMAMIEAQKEVKEETGHDIHMRVGINSGHVILGDIGSTLYRRDHTVVGDNVNIAQRLENNAGRDGLLISAATYELVKDKVEAEPKEIQLKGKKEAFLCYQVKSVEPYMG